MLRFNLNDVIILSHVPAKCTDTISIHRLSPPKSVNNEAALHFHGSYQMETTVQLFKLFFSMLLYGIIYFRQTVPKQQIKEENQAGCFACWSNISSCLSEQFLAKKSFKWTLNDNLKQWI